MERRYYGERVIIFTEEKFRDSACYRRLRGSAFPTSHIAPCAALSALGNHRLSPIPRFSSRHRCRFPNVSFPRFYLSILVCPSLSVPREFIRRRRFFSSISRLPWPEFSDALGRYFCRRLELRFCFPLEIFNDAGDLFRLLE